MIKVHNNYLFSKFGGVCNANDMKSQIEVFNL